MSEQADAEARTNILTLWLAVGEPPCSDEEYKGIQDVKLPYVLRLFYAADEEEARERAREVLGRLARGGFQLESHPEGYTLPEGVVAGKMLALPNGMLRPLWPEVAGGCID